MSHIGTQGSMQAILKWNPGSLVYVQRIGRLFQRMYVSLATCKQGFLAACRLVNCIDACFLKGEYVG
jgi:hypothetical protein